MKKFIQTVKNAIIRMLLSGSQKVIIIENNVIVFESEFDEIDWHWHKREDHTKNSMSETLDIIARNN